MLGPVHDPRWRRGMLASGALITVVALVLMVAAIRIGPTIQAIEGTTSLWFLIWVSVLQTQRFRTPWARSLQPHDYPPEHRPCGRRELLLLIAGSFGVGLLLDYVITPWPFTLYPTWLLAYVALRYAARPRWRLWRPREEVGSDGQYSN